MLFSRLGSCGCAAIASFATARACTTDPRSARAVTSRLANRAEPHTGVAAPLDVRTTSDAGRFAVSIPARTTVRLQSERGERASCFPDKQAQMHTQPGEISWVHSAGGKARVPQQATRYIVTASARPRDHLRFIRCQTKHALACWMLLSYPAKYLPVSGALANSAFLASAHECSMYTSLLYFEYVLDHSVPPSIPCKHIADVYLV